MYIKYRDVINAILEASSDSFVHLVTTTREDGLLKAIRNERDKDYMYFAGYDVVYSIFIKDKNDDFETEDAEVILDWHKQEFFDDLNIKVQ